MFLILIRSPAIAPSMAQTPTATPSSGPGDTISLELLNFQDQVLNGPASQRDYFFRLPEDWKLEEGAELTLDLTAFVNSSDGFELGPGMIFGKLLVEVNREVIHTISLTETGQQQITLPIPLEVLEDVLESGSYLLRIQLAETLDCDSDLSTSIVVHTTSFFTLPHTTISPELDLARLPSPLYQRTFLPDQATLVVPEQPTAAELQAMLAVASGFGRMTNNNLAITVTTTADLPATLRNETHLIFVGKLAQLPQVMQMDLSIPTDGSAFPLPGDQLDDGVVQIGISPWNRSRAVLVVSGNTDAGVVKAGQAISSGSLAIAAGERPTIAIIADVHTDTAASSNIMREDSTLAELGYPNITREGNGEHQLEYSFFMPPGYVTTQEAYLDLSFIHSALLDYELSGLSVTINNTIIGNVQFGEETTVLSRAKFNIAPEALQVGSNRLVVTVALIPRNICLSSDLRGIWATVMNDSLLHIPRIPAEERNLPAFDLEQYPELFVVDPTLNRTAFVLPRSDVAAWESAAHIMMDLGSSISGEITESAVFFGDAITRQQQREYNFIIVGAASQLPIVAELRQYLPIPFEENSDLAQTQGRRIIYRFPPDAAVGYIQLLPSPWNEELLILAALGNTQDGIREAGSVLTEPGQRNELAGNFAIINNDEIASGDTRQRSEPGVVAATAVPTGTIEWLSLTETMGLSGTADIDAASSEQPAGQPDWLVPAMAASTGLIVLILVGMGVFTLWRRRFRQNKGTNA